jgi:hypothetical protein
MLGSIRPMNIRRARRRLREEGMEEENYDYSVIPEGFPILKDGEISFPYDDKKFAYVFGIKNFVEALRTMGEVRIDKPGKRYKNVEQLIVLNNGQETITFKKMKEIPLYIVDEDDNKTIIASHPIRRYADVSDGERSKKQKSIFTVLKDYQHQLCPCCFLRKVDETLKGEWNKIYEGRKPDYAR